MNAKELKILKDYCKRYDSDLLIHNSDLCEVLYIFAKNKLEEEKIKKESKTLKLKIGTRSGRYG